MKYLFLALMLVACCPKKPEQTSDTIPFVVKDESISVVAGYCYRYPNSKQQDVHMKVIRTYDKGGFFAQFIYHQKYFNHVHDFTNEVRHLKEIDCTMYDDLKSISKPFGDQ